MLGQRQIVPGINIDDVVAGALGEQCGGAVACPHRADVAQIHLARLPRRRHGERLGAGCERRLAALLIGAGDTLLTQLDRRQRAMFVHRIDHAGVIGNVACVPKTPFDRRGEIGAMVDSHFLGRDHRPAAFRLDPAHGGHAAWVALAHAVAMRHLIKAVTRRDRADLHRLEQNVENRVASAHGLLLLKLAT